MPPAFNLTTRPVQGAIKFSGTGTIADPERVVFVNSKGFALGADWQVELFYQLDALKDSPIFAHGESASDLNLALRFINTGEKITCIFSIGGVLKTITSALNVFTAVGETHHITARRNGDTAAIYIDGVQSGTILSGLGVTANDTSASVDWALGIDLVSDSLEGIVDSVRIWTDGFTAAETLPYIAHELPSHHVEVIAGKLACECNFNRARGDNITNSGGNSVFDNGILTAGSTGIKPIRANGLMNFWQDFYKHPGTGISRAIRDQNVHARVQMIAQKWERGVAVHDGPAPIKLNPTVGVAQW